MPAARPVIPPARELLAERDYVWFWASRFAGSLGAMIESVVLGWQMYNIARDQHYSVEQSAFWVGMIGLAAFLPVLLLTLTAGEAADRHDRRTVLLASFLGEIVSVAVLTFAAWKGLASIPLLLCVAVGFGAARAFMAPASTALGPMLVRRELLPRAIAWNSLAWQTASVAGPAVAGLLIAGSVTLGYSAALVLYVVSAVGLMFIRANTKPQVQAGSRWALMKEGLRYVWENKIVFGSISLDLFAVLLAGATALLPVYARDILHVGPEGFGLLRAAPAVGAVGVALVIAARPIHTKAGVWMFGAVGLFAAATVAFGLSRSTALSIVALALLGGADMVSVYVRQTLVQLVTPDNMRGRVAAVSSVFIGASNELGEFRGGVFARFLGPVGAVVWGGVGALVVTGLWAWMFPALRKADRLE